MTTPIAPPPPASQPLYTPPTPAAPVPRNGFGITALVLAIVGLVFGFVPLTGFLALILGALAVLFGLLGWARARRGEANNLRMASIGTILGVGAAALGIWGISITFNAVDQFGRDLQDIGQQSAPVSALQDSPQINNFTVRNDGTASFQEQEYVGTSSSRATLMAKVTSISES